MYIKKNAFNQIKDSAQDILNSSLFLECLTSVMKLWQIVRVFDLVYSIEGSFFLRFFHKLLIWLMNNKHTIIDIQLFKWASHIVYHSLFLKHFSECPTGFYSRGEQTHCKKCGNGFYGKRCRFVCRCNSTERYNNNKWIQIFWPKQLGKFYIYKVWDWRHMGYILRNHFAFHCWYFISPSLQLFEIRHVLFNY